MNDIDKVSDCNSWDYVRSIREQLMNKDLVLHEMEEVWNVVLSEQASSEECLNDFRSDEQLGKTPLDAFMHLVERCQYAPPEIIIAINDCFQLYLAGKGEFELEEIFFANRRIPKLGNNSAQRAKYKKHRMFYAHCLIEHDLNPDSKRKSKVVMASSFLESMGWGDEDPESFLRQHRAWIKEQKDKYKQKTEK